MHKFFPAGKPVRGRALVGRKTVLDEVESLLDIDQSVILVAPRRYGKTSIALETIKNFRAKGVFVANVDMFEVTDKRHLAEKIIESCLKNNDVPLHKYWHKLKKGALNVLSMLKFKPSDEDMEMVLQLGMPKVDEDKLLDDALDFPQRFCRSYKRTMIFFIDEFQEVVKVGGYGLLKKMRAKYQLHDDITYLFAGSQEGMMKELFQNKQHAFYRFGRLVEVGPIAKEDFRPYISRTFACMSIKIDADVVELILGETGGHPYYTQLLCQIIYVSCLQAKVNYVDRKMLIDAQESLLVHEQALFDEIWKELGGKKYARSIVGLIAQGGNPYSYQGSVKEGISRVLSELVRYGYLTRIGKGKATEYRIKDPFFRRYVSMKMPQ